MLTRATRERGSGRVPNVPTGGLDLRNCEVSRAGAGSPLLQPAFGSSVVVLGSAGSGAFDASRVVPAVTAGGESPNIHVLALDAALHERIRARRPEIDEGHAAPDRGGHSSSVRDFGGHALTFGDDGLPAPGD